MNHVDSGIIEWGLKSGGLVALDEILKCNVERFILGGYLGLL